MRVRLLGLAVFAGVYVFEGICGGWGVLASSSVYLLRALAISGFLLRRRFNGRRAWGVV
jgi:hypothetical protein